jgi:hypothetical protein
MRSVRRLRDHKGASLNSPEKNKRAGVCYATTRDGVELPVVDVTHPAFALNVGVEERRAAVRKFMQEGRPFAWLPGPGIKRSQGTFMTGLHTYLLKLGPDMLPSAFAKPIDRKIAEAVPTWGVRLRLQDIAELTADTLLPALQADPKKRLHLLNIAGGPASDSLNALLILLKRQPEILAERSVLIEILDLDEAGAAFGKASLAALSETNGPLHACHIELRHIPYNWSDVGILKDALNRLETRSSIVFCSSEGGLFEYGSDEDIVSNLKVLRQCVALVGVSGSVTRADEAIARLRSMGTTAATRPRGLAVFRDLVEKAGWQVSRVIEGPFSDQVLLT